MFKYFPFTTDALCRILPYIIKQCNGMSKTEIIKATIQYQHYQHIYPQRWNMTLLKLTEVHLIKTECKHLKAFTL